VITRKRFFACLPSPQPENELLITLFAPSEEFGKIGKDIVFMAGERVLRDAIVVPFSRGCNLLTVYSKKHIDSEPELKTVRFQKWWL
jgi:glycerol-3-phosphate O-acyltransferase